MLKFLLLSLILILTVSTEDTADPNVEDDVVNDVVDDVVDGEDDDDDDDDDDDVDDDDVDDDDVDDDDVDEDEDVNQDDSTSDQKGGQTMSFSQPSLTEEEQKSHHFPGRYKCEACQIIVHNLGTDFTKAESKIPKKKKKRALGDVEIMEIVDEVCSKDKFSEYSIQDFGGKVTFKGPAFPHRKEAGMSMGGGMWPIRYTNYCGSVFEDIEEDEAYEAYREGELFAMLCLERDCKGVLENTPEILDFRPANMQNKPSKEEL